MKKLHKLLFVLFAALMFAAVSQAQPYKARLGVDYVKEMNGLSKLEIEAKYKEGKKYKMADGLQLNIYRQVVEDSVVMVGSVITDMHGTAQYTIDLASISIPDSVIKHTFYVKIEDVEQFKDAKKKVSFTDVNLIGSVTEKDSLIFINASLTDVTGAPIEKEKISVSVQRLFAPLTIGKSSYKTNNKGKIKVEMENPLPGVDSNLTFEVSMDSRKYGQVKHVFEAPVGELIVDRSTFDQRTMWSPPSKTPIFLLIFPNLLILAVWIIIFILVNNLVKIYKA